MPGLLRFFYAMSGVICCFVLSWILLACQQFFYPTLYKVADFSSHMQRYAGQNRFKPDFAQTDAQEHKRLFAEINYAVHLAPQNLSEIRYYSPDKQHSGVLLHFQEIQHLQDVAQFIRHMWATGLLALAVYIACIFGISQYDRKLPSKRSMLYGAGVCGLVSGLLLWIFGPTRVFYFAHTLIFPKNHPWFFYYQDSLMSTLMKAPDLFAYIALELAVLSGLLFTAQHLLLRRFLLTRC